MERSIAKGTDAVDYIKEIDTKLYARHAFPLPRLGKISSNPAEQANSGLLPIREYAPLKLLVELWAYIQKTFNDRQRKAEECSEVYSQPALRRHRVNLRTFGQWIVQEDGQSMAKVLTTDGRDEYLVKLGQSPSCTCVELQEMQWPCEHIMAWDDKIGKDFTRHFQPCWKVASICNLYRPRVPVFLSNDLEPQSTSFPPEAAVKKGRHRVVRIPSGGRSIRPHDLGADEYLDAEGNLFRQYPIDDDPNIVGPLASADATRRSQRGTRQRRPRRSGGRSCNCSVCGQAGHNKRTCHKKLTPTYNTTIPSESLVNNSIQESHENAHEMSSGEETSQYVTSLVPASTNIADRGGLPIYPQSDSSDHSSDLSPDMSIRQERQPNWTVPNIEGDWSILPDDAVCELRN